MGILIDREALFKEKMKTGINLFTGSGFSVLPYNGVTLPTGSALCKEVCTRFEISENYENDLETISALAPKQGLQEYLRDKFTVSGCNELYLYINNINLHSLITTNIDNIPHHFVSNGNRYFLKSITYYGASKSSHAKLEFIPLHGDVTNYNFPLYFGKFDLAFVDEMNNELFSAMYAKLIEYPTFFWGYGFHDSGVLKIISKILGRKAQDFWVQCLPGNDKMINLFRKMNCNVIVAETEQLLLWIKENIQRPKEIDHSEDEMSAELRDYFIPTIADVESLPAAEYYVKGVTHWYPILTKQAYECSAVNDIYNAALENKILILVGGNFVGKMTILMQLALKIESKHKLFIKEAISKEEAEFIISKIGANDTWIFCAKGMLDIDSLRAFSSKENVHIISIADDYSFETSKHLLTDIAYFRHEIGELERLEAERIFEHVPPALRKEKFLFKNSNAEKYSMLELILKNIRGVYSRERITRILLAIKDENFEAIKTIALASYLSSNDSALSTDVIISFFNLSDYNDAHNIVRHVNSLLNSYEIDMHPDIADQDYYVLRSKLFSTYANEAFTRNIALKNIYADVIKNFIHNVSTLKIYNYHIFRRKAYDGTLFADLFGSDGESIYNFLYDRYQNPYTLQQFALFLGKIGKDEEAFSYINKARGELPGNFSIKNSEAILLFEANKKKKTDLALSKMTDAMSILEDCYKNDKRKVHHAQKYAEFALTFYNEYQNTSYISKAKTWINEIISKKDSLSRRTKHLKRELDFVASE